jgi:hypothetical protein
MLQGAEHKSFAKYEDAVEYLQEGGIQVNPDGNITSLSQTYQGSQNHTSNVAASFVQPRMHPRTGLTTDDVHYSIAPSRGVAENNHRDTQCAGTQQRVEQIIEGLISRSYTIPRCVHVSPSCMYELVST